MIRCKLLGHKFIAKRVRHWLSCPRPHIWDGVPPDSYCASCGVRR